MAINDHNRKCSNAISQHALVIKSAFQQDTIIPNYSRNITPGPGCSLTTMTRKKQTITNFMNVAHPNEKTDICTC